MPVNFWLGVFVGAIAAGIGFATLVLRISQRWKGIK
jgi:hypothetical protein